MINDILGGTQHCRYDDVINDARKPASSQVMRASDVMASVTGNDDLSCLYSRIVVFMRAEEVPLP